MMIPTPTASISSKRFIADQCFTFNDPFVSFQDRLTCLLGNDVLHGVGGQILLITRRLDITLGELHDLVDRRTGSMELKLGVLLVWADIEPVYGIILRK